MLQAVAQSISCCSRERQVHIADGFIDLLRALEADCSGIYSGVLKRELHGFHAIVVTILELAASAKFHADYAQAFAFQRVDVIDNFADVRRMIGVFVGGAVHAGAVVIDADQSYVEPVCAWHLAKRG